MVRFIMLSFGFMGWAFYEMSGGNEFDATAVRTARLEAEAAEKAAKAPPTAAVVAQADKAFIDTDPPLAPAPAEVTRVSLNLTSLETTPQQKTVTVPKNVGNVTSSADTPAIIPSLIDPNDGVTTTAAANGAGLNDIRTVSGNRVNVRGGPGTDFGIVSRLVRGDEVKIVQDDGNGWVRFETLDGDTGGWMADFLLTNG
ncbi:hypothetical protein Z946_1133 [Sulfitobacter noctilucicola]|uniref:SH3b domain-containing protein n=1 Tax=Sulfitobacter noctilucicola TaxID=1342301 RepID=A0A7W6M6C2_9RHOB|nr:SH3 domain-containing protein [Sulfitobacter noctilucicola]KIN62276.1 hypothetical protein Z946_1133 [Sulfitobacter noctilucicola]MBB4173189.1 hypothetical protein [Sulfitobacter noctilucicola]